MVKDNHPDRIDMPKTIGEEVAPSIFIDGVSGFLFDGFNIKMRLYQNIGIISSENKIEAVQRIEAHISMNFLVFRQIAVHFQNMLDDIDRLSPAIGDVEPKRANRAAAPGASD